MGTSSNDSGKPTQPPDRSTVILLLGDIADTTWRMFGPTLLFVGLGFWADAAWKTEPWFILSGLAIGVASAAILIKKQFQKINENHHGR